MAINVRVALTDAEAFVMSEALTAYINAERVKARAVDGAAYRLHMVRVSAASAARIALSDALQVAQDVRAERDNED